MTVTDNDTTGRGTTTRPLAVVTGASSGIGYELARQFVDNGFDVLIAAEDADIHEVARGLAASGCEATGVRTDLSTYDGVEDLYAVIRASGRAVDAAAINAGRGASGEFASATDLKDELEVIGLNVTGTVHLAKRLATDMVERGTGRLLFTASIAALMPGPYYAVYAASKAFVYSFAEAIRHELKDTGVTVTALLPGPTDTEFFDVADMEGTRADAGPKDDPADVAKDGFEALMAGDDHVVAGSKRNAAQAVAAKVMSPTAAAAVHGKLTEPGAASD